MAFNNTPSRLYILLIIIVGIVAGYLIYGQIIKPQETGIAPPKQDNSLNPFRNIKLDFNKLSDATKDLIISGESPVKPQSSNTKKDLFAPIP